MTLLLCAVCGSTGCGDHACETVVEEYEILAERCAKAGTTYGAFASLPWQALPRAVRTALEEEILFDEGAFQRRVRDYAYAQAMEGTPEGES